MFGIIYQVQVINLGIIYPVYVTIIFMNSYNKEQTNIDK